jgi:hypothetical protein
MTGGPGGDAKEVSRARRRGSFLEVATPTCHSQTPTRNRLGGLLASTSAPTLTHRLSLLITLTL